MTEPAPFSPADKDLLGETPYAFCENLADAGRLLARIVPRDERTVGFDDNDPRSEEPLSQELLNSLSEDIRVQHFYRSSIHLLSRLGSHEAGPLLGHNSVHRSWFSNISEDFFTEGRFWYRYDIKRFVKSITDSAISTVLLCIQKLLVVLLRVNFRFRSAGSSASRLDLSNELQESQRHLCLALIENAVDSRGVHTLLRDALVEQLIKKIESAIEETHILEEATQLKENELYKVVARDLDREVAEARPLKAAAKSLVRVPTTRLSEEELARVVQVGADRPWSSRTAYRTDPLDWLWENYQPWIGHGLVQTDLKKADFNFYFALKRRMAKGSLPQWLVLPGTSDIRQQDAVDHGATEQHDRLRAVERLRSRLYRGRAQLG